MAIALFQWMMMGFATFAHPFYISMTDINYNNTNKSIEVSVRIFSNDFEDALKKSCHCKVELTHKPDKAAMDKLVNNYIVNRLQLVVDGKPVAMQYAGYQQEEGSIWSYFEVKNVAAVKKIEINNSLLYDYKEEQVNMVHLKVNGKDRSDKVEYPHKGLSFNF